MSAIDYVGPLEKAAAKRKGEEVLSHVPGALAITHVWGYDPNVNNTEHHSGLALDFMLYVNGQIDTQLGNRIYAYLWANRARLGVRHIIWQQTIISTVVQPGVRRPMADRGNPTANHMDHVHVTFFDTPYRDIPKGKAAVKKYPGNLLHLGSRGANVVWIQQRLNTLIHAHLLVDGIYGSQTAAAVYRYQSAHKDLVNDGIVGKNTWASLAVVR